MYIPKQFQFEDREALFLFMKQNSFATIVSSYDNLPEATQLPFIVENRNEQIFLISHFAKANPHWKQIENSTCLFIFNGPHAYISPTHYENKESVPTWNYITVFAYGKPSIIEDEGELFNILKKTISNYDHDYLKQWEGLSLEYKSRMIKGIVAFETEITKIEGKKKLSQNRSLTDQNNIIQAFEKSTVHFEQEIAQAMKR